MSARPACDTGPSSHPHSAVCWLWAAACLLLCWPLPAAQAATEAPWGTAAVADTEYPPSRVVYDLTSGRPAALENLLDRVSYLYQLTGSDPFESSIVVVIHGDAIPLFTLGELPRYRELMTRARSLAEGTTIEFRMCSAAARLIGVEARDVHGFVTMVPMADAELIQLQQSGYAYMR